MTIYIDTSALVPIFIREPMSAAVIDWLQAETDRLAISDWCLVEFTAAAALKVRTGQTSTALAAQAAERVRDFARGHCTVATPGVDEFRRAADLAANRALKLRAGDALHLAIAVGLGARAILCLDAAMIGSARLLGLGVATI